jgi:hypothetical protein
VPEEYSQRRKPEELLCWTDEAKQELKPKKLHEVLKGLADQRLTEASARLAKMSLDARNDTLRKEWSKLLGNVEPAADPRRIEGPVEAVTGGKLARFTLEVEHRILVPLMLIAPAGSHGKTPAVVMVAQAGKAAFLKERGDVISTFLKGGVAVCLVDVRGTGETKAGSSAERGSTRTSISQTELILGQTVVGNQLRDLRTVIRWLRTRPTIERRKIAVWGDSFAATNASEKPVAVPLELGNLPTVSEPNAALLALLASLFDDVEADYANGGLASTRSLLNSPYIYTPHEAIIAGSIRIGDAAAIADILGARSQSGFHVDSLNHRMDGKTNPDEAAAAIVMRLNAK